MEEKGVPLRLEHFANETVQFLKSLGQFMNVGIIYTSRSNSGKEKTVKAVSEFRYDFVVSVEVPRSEDRFLGIKINRIFSARGPYKRWIIETFSSVGFSYEEAGEKDWQWTFVNKSNNKVHIKPALSLAAYGFVRCFFLID